MCTSDATMENDPPPPPPGPGRTPGGKRPKITSTRPPPTSRNSAGAGGSRDRPDPDQYYRNFVNSLPAVPRVYATPELTSAAGTVMSQWAGNAEVIPLDGGFGPVFRILDSLRAEMHRRINIVETDENWTGLFWMRLVNRYLFRHYFQLRDMVLVPLHEGRHAYNLAMRRIRYYALLMQKQ